MAYYASKLKKELRSTREHNNFLKEQYDKKNKLKGNKLFEDLEKKLENKKEKTNNVKLLRPQESEDLERFGEKYEKE